MIALVTDSVSQIPPDLASRFGVTVVPVVVRVDGVEYCEGIDLTADQFWERISGGAMPDLGTSQPSPGEFAAVYGSLVDGGAEAIVSVHVGADHSGTLNSARLAAEDVGVDVHLVDTGTVSFGVSCCVWEAGAALRAGATAEQAASRARVVATTVRTCFIIQALDFARRGGRFDPSLVVDDGIAVLSGRGSEMEVIAAGHTVDELCDAMVAPFVAEDRPIRAGVCLADPATLPFTEGIEARLRAADVEVEMVRYRVGPSIAAHTGPGTAGGFWYPILEE